MHSHKIIKYLTTGAVIGIAVTILVGSVTLYQNIANSKNYVAQVNSAIDSVTSATTLQSPAQPSCVISKFDANAVGDWQNLPFINQTFPFTAEFDATPSGSYMNGVMALSNGAGKIPGNFAVLLRFNTSGKIDARNGSAYAAITKFSYIAGQTYHFRLVINPQTHSYSAFVRTSTGNEVVIARGYKFRTEQALTPQINSRGVISLDARYTINMCNFAITTQTVLPVATAVTPTVSGASCLTTKFDTVTNDWQNRSFPLQLEPFSAVFDAVPNSPNIHGITALSYGPGKVPNDFAILVRFSPTGIIDARNGAVYSALTRVPYYARETYHFRVVVNPQAHTYSVFVTSPTAGEVMIAKDYKYRTSQSFVAQFNNRGLLSFSAPYTHSVCNFAIVGITEDTLRKGENLETSAALGGGGASLAQQPLQAPAQTPTVPSVPSVPAANQSPISDAGSDRTITLPTNSITINGSATDADGSISSTVWTQISGPSTATLSGASSLTLTASNLVQGTYVFQLVATDNGGLTFSDRVNVVVNAATVVNQAPVANAGVDKTITLPTNSTTLTGSATDSTGTISSTRWTQVSGPSTATLSGTTGATLTASNLVQGTYVFQYAATDNGGLTGTDSAVVTVNAAANILPTVSAGGDKSITLPTNSTSLSGSATDSDGTISTYAWTQVSGPSTATLSGSTGATLAVSNLIEGSYVFRLTATDNRGGSASSNATVTVSPAVVVTPPSSSGWTTLNQASDARLIYVSSSSGSDTNAGTQASPVRTIAKALTLTRNGYPDWILLKSGDVFTESIDWTRSGRSSNYPAVLTSYGTGARPSVRPPAGRDGWNMSAGGQNTHDIAIVGIEFYAITRDPATPGYSAATAVGVSWYGPGSNLLVEDCYIRFFTNNIVVQGAGSGASGLNNFNLKRSVLADSYALSSISHAQGVYVSYVNGITITENIFDHNGWNSSVSGAEKVIFNHNIYLDNENLSGNNIVSNNIIAKGSSHGLQLRPGGTVNDNLFVENAISLLLGGGDGYQTSSPNGVSVSANNNVILYGGDIDAANPRGWGVDMVNIAGGTFNGNIIAHDRSSRSWGHGISIDDPTRNLSLTNNIVYDWHTPLSQNTTGVTASGNTYTNYGAGNIPGYSSPDRDLASYNATLGGAASIDAFLSRARQQSRSNWSDSYTSASANTYIRNGFSTGN